MDQSAKIHFTIQKDQGREYSFVLPMNAPIGEMFDVVFAVLQEVSNLAKQAADKAQASVQQPTDVQPEVQPQVVNN